MTDHPLEFSNFEKYIGTDIWPYVFPIIPVGSKLRSHGFPSFFSFTSWSCLGCSGSWVS